MSPTRHLPGAGADLLYGRVDLMAGVVLELEVAEPSLYLGFDDGAARRFAAAIVGASELRRPPGPLVTVNSLSVR